MSRHSTRPWLAALLGLIVAACSGPILANPPPQPVAPATPTPGPTRAPDPQPIVFPRDDDAHDRLTEWWYYTGHLVDMAEHRWGFEFVVFRAERGGFPVTWASHLALTDEGAGTFVYDQRSEIGPQVDQAAAGDRAFTFAIRGASPLGSAAAEHEPWVMSNAGGPDKLVAASPLGFAIDLARELPLPRILHGEDGWIDFGPAGGSYYYSRPNLQVAGTITVGGEDHAVTGQAWFDHQWGDFISVGGGGWDWFAVNLADGTALTISKVRAADGTYPLVFGTYLDVQGRAQHLDAGDFTVTADPARTWTSPATGVTYPAGWQILVPGQLLVIDLQPSVAAQELDTRATTGVVYWEGSQVVKATRNGTMVGGEAYVELTGYAPALP
ncbi:MAG: hypothetical protein L0227_03735 [Chloroflexi bacterium]|nr:hypothetical protein [Chloroflexota bacterium]